MRLRRLAPESPFQDSSRHLPVAVTESRAENINEIEVRVDDGSRTFR